jgi:hypothetical protein
MPLYGRITHEKGPNPVSNGDDFMVEVTCLHGEHYTVSLKTIRTALPLLDPCDQAERERRLAEVAAKTTWRRLRFRERLAMRQFRRSLDKQEKST